MMKFIKYILTIFLFTSTAWASPPNDTPSIGTHPTTTGATITVHDFDHNGTPDAVSHQLPPAPVALSLPTSSWSKKAQMLVASGLFAAISACNAAWQEAKLSS